MAIRYDKDGTIATIMINRPEAMNAMDRETSGELAEAFQDFDQDADLLVAVLTGAGDKAFSAGADLKKMYGRARGWQHSRDLGSRAAVAFGAVSARLETGDRSR